MPIQDITPPENKPPGVNAPGIGVSQPTAAEKAAIEAQWASLRDAPKSLAMLVLWIDAHPEIITWARASVSKTFRFSE